MGCNSFIIHFEKPNDNVLSVLKKICRDAVAISDTAYAFYGDYETPFTASKAFCDQYKHKNSHIIPMHVISKDMIICSNKNVPALDHIVSFASEVQAVRHYYHSIHFWQVRDDASRLLRQAFGNILAISNKGFIICSPQHTTDEIGEIVRDLYSDQDAFPDFCVSGGCNGGHRPLFMQEMRALAGVVPQVKKPDLADLNALIGLEDVKRQIDSLIARVAMNAAMVTAGMKPRSPINKHLLLTGPPGTGKTSVARIYPQLLHQMGLLSKGHIVETNRAGLVAGYIGQTESKTVAVLESARGGALFIDEAHALYSTYSDDFGRRAVDQIVKFMEDKGDDFALIMAGYPDDMQKLIDVNDGLSSRFGAKIEFQNYNTRKLLEIAHGFMKEWSLVAGAEFDKIFSSIIEKKRETEGKNFGNARFVRNALEAIDGELALRLHKEGHLKKTLSASRLLKLRTVTVSDLRAAAKQLCNYDVPITDGEQNATLSSLNIPGLRGLDKPSP